MSTPAPTSGKQLPDSLFIFVMCCCAVAIMAVTFVFVYYCYLNNKLCFRGRRNGRRRAAPADGPRSPSVDGSAHRYDPDSAAGRGRRTGSADGRGGGVAVDMEERLLPPGQEEAEAIIPVGGHTGAAAATPNVFAPPAPADPHVDVSNRPMDAAALSRAQLFVPAHQVRNLDRGDVLTSSGVNQNAAQQQQHFQHGGGERGEFLVLPEKETSNVATASSNGSQHQQRSPETASAASGYGGTAAARRWMGEWLHGVVAAYCEAAAAGGTLDDPAPLLQTSGAQSPPSSDRSDSETRPTVPTMRRLQMLHRLSHASESSAASTQPSTTAGGGGGRSPHGGLGGGGGGHTRPPPGAVVPLSMALTSSNPPTRRNTGDSTVPRPRMASAPAALPPRSSDVVTLAQLMADPFGRGGGAAAPTGPPVVLTPFDVDATPPRRGPPAKPTAAEGGGDPDRAPPQPNESARGTDAPATAGKVPDGPATDDAAAANTKDASAAKPAEKDGDAIARLEAAEREAAGDDGTDREPAQPHPTTVPRLHHHHGADAGPHHHYPLHARGAAAAAAAAGGGTTTTMAAGPAPGSASTPRRIIDDSSTSTDRSR